MDNHPAEANFDSIRGKKPAHYDHKKVGGGNYREGGGTGFNLQEGTSAEGSTEATPAVAKVASEPPSPHAMMTQASNPLPTAPPGNATEGGVDLQVPPVRKY